MNNSHGEWISLSNGTPINCGRKCSICGYVVEFSTKECPNCKAKMIIKIKKKDLKRAFKTPEALQDYIEELARQAVRKEADNE